MDLLVQALSYFNISSTYNGLLKKISYTSATPYSLNGTGTNTGLLDRTDLLEKRKKMIGWVSSYEHLSG